MSGSDSQHPTYLYKLIPPEAAPPDPLPEKLPLSELDEKSGFIHLSTAHQVPGTLKHFFGDTERMYILKIPLKVVVDKIRWESPDKKVCGPRPDEGLFPHLYDGKLGSVEIQSVVTLDRGETGWDAVMKDAQSSWLVY